VIVSNEMPNCEFVWSRNIQLQGSGVILHAGDDRMPV
jgi:hypothetical protein